MDIKSYTRIIREWGRLYPSFLLVNWALQSIKEQTQEKKVSMKDRYKQKGGWEGMSELKNEWIRVSLFVCSLVCSFKSSTLWVSFGHRLALWQGKSVGQEVPGSFLVLDRGENQWRQGVVVHEGPLRTGGNRKEKRETVCLWSTMDLVPLCTRLFYLVPAAWCEVVYPPPLQFNPTNQRTDRPSFPSLLLFERIV